MSVRELHNSLIIDPNDGGLKYARDENGKIIINDSTLRLLLTPQLKQMSAFYKIMCGCECCISALRILAFILEFFKYLSRQDSNNECILLAEMQHSQPHMTL